MPLKSNWIPVLTLVAASHACVEVEGTRGAQRARTTAAVDDVQAIVATFDEIATRAAAADVGFIDDLYDNDVRVMVSGRWEDLDKTTARAFYQDILDRSPAAFSDLSYEIHETTVVGDWAFFRVTFRVPVLADGAEQAVLVGAEGGAGSERHG